MTTRSNFSTVDEYVETLPKEVKEIFQNLRAFIKRAIPDGVEGISYQIPVIKLNGKFVIYYAGWKTHVSLYPIPTGDASFQKEIAPYVAGKGTLKFDIDKPIPYELITQVIKNSLKRNVQQKL